jgi:phosphatidylserine decarboxylase
MSPSAPTPTPASPAEGHADGLRRLLWRLVPARVVSAVVEHATRVRWRPWSQRLIRWFVARYGVDLSEAREPDPAAYPHFNSFFTRALRPDARPLELDSAAVLCPADGCAGALGSVEGGTLLQAKGRPYTLDALLGGEPGRSAPFQGGGYLTVYLSPRDYHRVHMPVSGRLREMVHVPGRLYSVSPGTVRLIPGLFAANERVVSLWETELGPMAVVMVGAICVGGIEHVWHGPVTPARRREPRIWRYGEAQAVSLAQGEEMGRFNMGSTVVVVLGHRSLRWEPGVREDGPVRMGQRVGRIRIPGRQESAV